MIYTDLASPGRDFQADVSLAKAAGEGDEGAARKIALRLMPEVRRTAFSIATGSSNGDDYAQSAMIEILRSLNGYKGLSSLENWAKRITIRHSVRVARQTGWRGKVVQTRAELDAPANVDIEKEFSDRQMVRRVGGIIKELGPKFGLMLQLRIVLGYSINEISEMTGVPSNTVRERLRVGRKRLHQAIEEDPVLREWPQDDED